MKDDLIERLNAYANRYGLPEDNLLREAATALSSQAALEEALRWISVFAAMRAKDDSKTFARVNREALRNIAEQARSALSSLKGDGSAHARLQEMRPCTSQSQPLEGRGSQQPALSPSSEPSAAESIGLAAAVGVRPTRSGWFRFVPSQLTALIAEARRTATPPPELVTDLVAALGTVLHYGRREFCWELEAEADGILAAADAALAKAIALTRADAPTHARLKGEG